MNNFEDVCLLSCENWVDSFPDEIPQHKFSKKYNDKMKELFQSEQNNKHKFSKKTLKFLLIAAILLSIATTVFAIPTSREYIVDKFSNHSEYNVIDTKKAKKVKSFNVNYIPAGFKKVEDEDYSSNHYYIEDYENSDRFFVAEKLELSSRISFDTEHYEPENIEINGADAVYFRSNNNAKGIIFNDGNYIYIITGNIEKDELVKIAQNLE